MTASTVVRCVVAAIVRGAASLVLLLSVSGSALAATFTFVNLDPPGVGYNDPTPASPVGGNTGATLGEQRLNSIRYAGEIWGGLLDSTVDIRVRVSTVGGCTIGGFTNILGVARDFAGAPLPNTWYPIALANKLAGVDLCPEGGSCASSDDINVLLARDCGWYLGYDVQPAINDWVSLMLHEMAHGLGFTTQMNIVTGAKFMGLDDVYMRNLEDHQTGKLYPNMTDAERVVGNSSPGDLHWVGQSVVAASGTLIAGAHPSGHVEMLAFSGGTIFGTSVYHFHSSVRPDQLMGAATRPTRDVGLALEVMRDIGWFTEDPPAWQCYQARDLRNPAFVPLTEPQTDAFGTRTASIRKPFLLCSAAVVGSGDPPTPRYAVCYRVRDVGPTRPNRVAVADQFGTLSLEVRKPRLLCVPATVSPLP